MKKVICLFLLVIFLGGCAHSKKYLGWQYVRIEKKVPNENCEYKIQESCSSAGAGCYRWYKQRATLYQANTVVLTETSKDRVSSGSALMIDGVGGGGYNSTSVLTALADYYYCPKKIDTSTKE